MSAGMVATARSKPTSARPRCGGCRLQKDRRRDAAPTSPMPTACNVVASMPRSIRYALIASARRWVSECAAASFGPEASVCTSTRTALAPCSRKASATASSGRFSSCGQLRASRAQRRRRHARSARSPSSAHAVLPSPQPSGPSAHQTLAGRGASHPCAARRRRCPTAPGRRSTAAPRAGFRWVVARGGLQAVAPVMAWRGASFSGM